MGLRLQKRIKVLPGVTVNLGKNGATSVSIGGRGAKVNIGQKGVKTTVGVPGTGLSYSTDTKTANKKTPAAEETLVPQDQQRPSWQAVALVAFILFALAKCHTVMHP